MLLFYTNLYAAKKAELILIAFVLVVLNLNYQ